MSANRFLFKVVVFTKYISQPVTVRNVNLVSTERETKLNLYKIYLAYIISKFLRYSNLILLMSYCQIHQQYGQDFKSSVSNKYA